jgi:hypothetical protein
MKTENEIPRRARLDLFTPAEKSIYDAMGEVEKAGADVRLTNALSFLMQAKNLIADYIEGIDMPIDLPPASPSVISDEMIEKWASEKEPLWKSDVDAERYYRGRILGAKWAIQQMSQPEQSVRDLNTLIINN